MKACWGQKHECSLNRVHAGRERGLSTLVPLFCTSILAVMLQKVVAVSMIGRALVLFFNLIPWARGRKKKTYTIMQVSFSLVICLLHFPWEILTEDLKLSKKKKTQHKNQHEQKKPICTDPESSKCCVQVLISPSLSVLATLNPVRSFESKLHIHLSHRVDLLNSACRIFKQK